ncbi:MAG: glucosaminidase domain-containing protein [Bacteroidia bacterium]
MDNRAAFTQKYYDTAVQAGKKYNINPTVILAQAAHESGWGSSYLARNCHNFFGITAFGSTNEYWHGDKIPNPKMPKLVFRIYPSDLDGFMDFALLISHKYKAAAAVSNDSAKYAKAIAYSPYIDEGNGDNRPGYEKAVITNSKYIESQMQFLKKK